MDVKKLARIGFLVFVTLCSVFLIFINETNYELKKKAKTLIPEEFTSDAYLPISGVESQHRPPDGNLDDDQSKIREIFQAALDRQPSATEMEEMIQLLQLDQRYDKVYIFVESLKPKTFEHDINNDHTKVRQNRISIYYDIVNVYQNTLDRMPTPEELEKYYVLMTENGVSLQLLIQILYNSREYKMLTKNQNNQVHGDVIGNYTDAQLSLYVKDYYFEVFNSFPEESVLEFLKERLRTYELDLHKFKSLLHAIKQVDNVQLNNIKPNVEQFQQSNPSLDVVREAFSTIEAHRAGDGVLRLTESDYIRLNNFMDLVDKEKQNNAPKIPDDLDDNHNASLLSDYVRKRQLIELKDICARNQMFCE